MEANHNSKMEGILDRRRRWRGLPARRKLLRAMNASAALAHLIEPGQLTRADLKRLTALSTPTISEVLRRLTDAGLVVRRRATTAAGPGPNAEIYAANPDAAYAAAVSVRDTRTPRRSSPRCAT